jgi:4-cresol dehydrogenase (hydroxylating)
VIETTIPTGTISTGLSDAQLQKALDALRAEVGADHVLTGDDALEFRDPYYYRAWTEHDASAVVQPSSVEEVQAVLRIANAYGVPIWTTSQGRNNGYGGSSPRVKGSVVMNLRRMNRILEINEELGYAVVEPGVTFTQLYEAIRDGGHKLMLSSPDLGYVSVTGNALENGLTYGVYGADQLAPCGMEVVLANGEVLRTGMGAMPDNKAWHLYRRSLGPTLDPLFRQSNFGVVVKMGVWLAPIPEVFASFWADFSREADLIPLVDTLRRLRLDRTLEGAPVLYNAIGLAQATDQRTRWYDGDGPTPDHIIDQIARDLDIGRWTLHGGVWDDNAVTDHKIKKITAAFEQIPGAQIRFSKHAPEEIPQLKRGPDRVFGGVPHQDWANLTRWTGSNTGAHAMAGLVVPLQGKEAFRAHTLLRQIIERDMGMDYGAYTVNVNARTYIHIFGTVYDVTNEAETRRAYEATRRIVTEGAKAGFGEYRAHLYNMDVAPAQYSFNDHVYRRFVETIKDAVDPNGVLAPGKQSIWPQSYRRANGRSEDSRVPLPARGRRKITK